MRQKDLSQNLTTEVDTYFGWNIYFYESKAGEKAVQRNELVEFGYNNGLRRKIIFSFLLKC